MADFNVKQAQEYAASEGYGYAIGENPPQQEQESGLRGIPGFTKPTLPFNPKKLGQLKGPRNFLEASFSNINYDLLVSKTFYFFFFAAFGSLFPLIAIYFKQLGMNPAQTGLLIGLRPFVEILSAPLWGSFADKWRKGKMLLLFSLFCWVAFTLALAFIHPSAAFCLTHNKTDVIVVKPYTERKKRSIDESYHYNLEEMNRNMQHPGFESAINRYLGYNQFADEVDLPMNFDAIVDAKRDKAPDRQKEKTPSGDKESAGEKEKNTEENDEEPMQREQEGDRKGNKGKSKEKGDKAKTKDEKDEKGGEERNKAESTTAKAVEDVSAKHKTTTAKPATMTNPGKTTTKSKTTPGEGTSEKPVPSTPKASPTPDAATRLKIKHLHILPHPVVEVYGKSPLPLDHKDIANLDQIDVRGLVSPPYSNVVYYSKDIYNIFLVLLLMMILGEFLSAPSIVMADSVTLGYLGDDADLYGKQRIYGSLGWAIAMFFVGIALDHSSVFPNHPCGQEQLVDRNYTVCFAVFSILMCCAFIAATQMRFQYSDDEHKQNIALARLGKPVPQEELVQPPQLPQPPPPHQEFDAFSTQSNGTETSASGNESNRKVHISLQNDDGLTSPLDAVDDVTKNNEANRPSPYAPRGKMGILPDWLSVLKLFGNVRFGCILYMLWYMGFGVGLGFTFLYWHLQDLNGTPTLFGMTSVISHSAEILAYFFGRRVIAKIGHMRLLYIGLVANVARFLYISWIRNPWLVLPFEFIHGLNHALVWAACCTYLTQSMPLACRNTATTILLSIYHGLGRGCGALIGGPLVLRFGTEMTFRGYGIACILIVIAYGGIDYFYLRKQESTEGVQEPRLLLQEGAHMAPHGVPMSMPNNPNDRDPGQPGGASGAYGSTTGGQAGLPDQPNTGGGGGGGGYYQTNTTFHQGYQGGTGGYGYHHDPEVTPPIAQEERLILNKRESPIRGEHDIIRKKFQAYQDLTSSQDIKRDSLMMGIPQRSQQSSIYSSGEQCWY